MFSSHDATATLLALQPAAEQAATTREQLLDAVAEHFAAQEVRSLFCSGAATAGINAWLAVAVAGPISGMTAVANKYCGQA